MADESVYSDAFRIDLVFLSESEGYAARVPDLGIVVKAQNRQDALKRAEQQIEPKIQELAESNERVPRPSDRLTESGELKLTLSPLLYKDLRYFSEQSGLSVEELARELLARGVGQISTGLRIRKTRDEEIGEQSNAHNPQEETSRNRGGPRNNNARNQNRGSSGEHPAQGAQAHHGQSDQRNGRGGRGRNERYRPELDDKANFLEYLRGLDKNQGRGGRR